MSSKPAGGDPRTGARSDSPNPDHAMSEKTVSVPNISCGHCVKTIERELADLGGVTAVKADAESRTVAVEWNDAETDWAAVEGLLDEIGYPAAS